MKKKLFDAYLRLYIWFMEKLGRAKWTTNYHRPTLINRAWVVLEEAKRRGLEVENLAAENKSLRFYRYKINGKYYYFECLPLGDSYNKTLIEKLTDKWFSKTVIQNLGIDVPQGKVVKSFKEALVYIQEKGFPVVIKPIDQSLCIGVTCNIKTFSALDKAIDKVRKYKKFLIEEYIEGENYRITIVDGRVVAVSHRVHPNVVGDGKHSIKELIEIKNRDPRRGKTKNFSLHPIKIDEFTEEILKKKKITLNSVPKKMEAVVLNQRINLGAGADSIDATDEIHPEIAELSVKVAKAFDAKLLGLDLIVPDISKAPSKTNRAVVIEVNSYPYIDMHHNPFRGKSRNVAGAIWDMIFKELGIEEIKK